MQVDPLSPTLHFFAMCKIGIMIENAVKMKLVDDYKAFSTVSVT